MHVENWNIPQAAWDIHWIFQHLFVHHMKLFWVSLYFEWSVRTWRKRSTIVEVSNFILVVSSWSSFSSFCSDSGEGSSSFFYFCHELSHHLSQCSNVKLLLSKPEKALSSIVVYFLDLSSGSNGSPLYSLRYFTIQVCFQMFSNLSLIPAICKLLWILN